MLTDDQIDAIAAALVDRPLSTGLFANVNGHEPVGTPVYDGITCAVWVETILPHARSSGLAATSLALTVFTRLYMRAGTVPEAADAVDPALTKATLALFRLYAADFQLTNQATGATLAFAVDLLGMAGGTGLSARAGYLTHQDGVPYRVYTITLPLIVADALAEGEG